MTMLGYIRVSTEEQAQSGLGLGAQRAGLELYERQHDTNLAIYCDDGYSGKTLERPALYEALTRIGHGEADGLVVVKLDRLTRSLLDFAQLLEWFKAATAALVAIDVGVDTSTPGGRMIAGVFAVVAEWEREMIAQRTKDGLAEARRTRGRVNQGAVADDPELLERICGLREEGETYAAICGVLNSEGVPTPRGGALWRPSALQRVLGGVRRPKPRAHIVLPEIVR